MPAPPLKTEISDTYPNPSNAVARVGFGKLWDVLFGGSGLLGATGDPADSRAALGVPAANDATLTGNPTATTQAAADNSTRIATTAWVRSAMANIASAAGFLLLAATPGYLKLPSWLGGVIFQWGTGNTSATGVTVTYPMAFPNAVWTFLTTALNNSATGVWTQTLSPSLTQTYVQAFVNSGTQTTTFFYWISVGR